MKNWFCTILAISFLTSSSLSAQNIHQLIQKTGQSLLRNKEFKAISIGVYKDGQTYTSHFGTLEKDKSTPPTDETRYEIGSVTKTFTGLLVAKAVLDGKLKLDEDIRNYLDGDYPNLAFEGTPITMRNLVTHTAGLPHSFNPAITEAYSKLEAKTPNLIYGLGKTYSKEIFLEALHNFKLTEKPGTNYNYSNAGAELTAFILTKVYGNSFYDLLNEFILTQAQMNHTSTQLDDYVAQGYWMDNEEPSQLSTSLLWSASTGLKSTLPDIMNYIAFNLSNNPMVEESHRLLYEKNTRWMGYFWNIWKDKHGTSFNHHGGTTGTQNWLYIFPKYNLGISIFVNHSGPKTPQKLNKAIKAILKEFD